MITRSRTKAAQQSARPPPPPASSSSSHSSSGDEYATAPDANSSESSSDERGPSPSPPPPPARRGRRPLPALEPTIIVSEQRLSDQVRVIQRLKRLDDATLDRLRQEALSARTASTSVRNLPATSPDPVPAPDLAPGAPPADFSTDEGDVASQSSDQRKVYRKWEETNPRASDTQPSDATAMTDFWRSIWSVPVKGPHSARQRRLREQVGAPAPLGQQPRPAPPLHVPDRSGTYRLTQLNT
ncbi:hepatoma-derived growth factor-related protein 2-like [Cydia pomonella]|uniref:hepatoma-derived growth factor-related protein 2-like n=1 Tax=Cydia pomonella TaxID=82600 RepID=UPI002ADE4E8A|nr:hepatoma-derived growth factor-related protein 2-like [Cydia pomonella]